MRMRANITDDTPEIFEETKFGFRWQAAEIERAISDKGWVIIKLKTPKYPYGIDLYVTATGKVRVFTPGVGEWTKP